MGVHSTIKHETSSEVIGKTRIPFGKYKGRELQDVPRSYLEWVLSVEKSSREFRELQSDVRAYLGIWEGERGPRGRWGRAVGVGLGDRLTREYLAIVRSS